MENTFIRQDGIFKSNDASILIIGCGGIGSTTALTLSKMGCSNLTILDYDHVEEHNVASQFFGEKDLGKLKTVALKENIEIFSPFSPNILNARFATEGLVGYRDGEPSGLLLDVPKYEVIIIAVDSIKARRLIYEHIKNKFELLIDGRMGGEFFEIYSVLGIEQEDYLKTLPEEKNIDRGLCTARAISYNTFGIASYIGALVKKFLVNSEIIGELAGCYVNFFITKEEND